MKSKIAYTLKVLGVPTNLSGFDCLIEAIDIVLKDHSKIHAITKELYPLIAEKCGLANKVRVERDIRHAIETAFNVAPPEVMQRVFGNTIDYNKGKVTNGTFIATIVEIITYEPDHTIFKGSRFEAKHTKVSLKSRGQHRE